MKSIGSNKLVGIISAAALAFAFISGPHSRGAQSVAVAASTIELQPVLTGLSEPAFVTNAHDGSQRLFIVEQPGVIKVLKPGATLPTVFLDISAKVLFGGEQGLLGLTFHPQYAQNRRFFLDYTRNPDGATAIAEYRTSDSNPGYTGVAIVNPGLVAAQVWIEVFDKAGWLLVSGDSPVPPRGRISGLLTQFFPTLAGQGIGAGYINITADRPVASFATIGTIDLSALSVLLGQARPD